MTDDAIRQQWNQRFASEAYVFGTAPNGFLASQKHLLRRGHSALAVAAGEGRNGVFLAEQGLDVLSVDIAEKGVEKARKLATSRGVRLRSEHADILAWNPPHGFDVIAAIFIQFATPPHRRELFAKFIDWLKPGGILILQGYRPEQLEYATGGPRQVENLYTTDMLRSAFAALTILHLREHDEVILEGEGHAGMSALIDLVARK
ncbi:MAG: Methyltransferase type 11 [Rhodospirillales bacterium]|nr:Methyltransferase type 11 [Rhodospirillales bacterium]